MDIDKILAEREKRYGTFETHAKLSQQLKSIMRASLQWENLTSDKKEALEMIQDKISRILNGDPDYADSWRDITGYSKLVADTLEGK